MKKKTHLNVIALSWLLVLVMLPSLGYAQQNQNGAVRYQQTMPSEDRALRERKWLAGLQARDGIHSKEKLVRRAYLLLMRYHRAANAETAAKARMQPLPENDIQFELRNMQTGPVEDILDEPISDVISLPKRNTLVVWPEYYYFNEEPKHVIYQVRWNEEGRSAEMDQKTSAEDIRLETTIREFLSSDPDFAKVESYTSYEVTLRLTGRERNYKAVAFHYGGPLRADGSTIRFVDLIAGDPVLSKTLKENLPPVRSPWSTYAKSATYRSVVRATRRVQEQKRKAQKQSLPLIPADAPVDYLPGDDAVPDNKEGQVLAIVVCQGFDFFVTFDRNDLYPSGAGSPTTATVIVQTTPPQANVNVGTNCDVFSGNVPTSQWAALNLIFFKNGVHSVNDETATFNHWHVRF